MPQGLLNTTPIFASRSLQAAGGQFWGKELTAMLTSPSALWSWIASLPALVSARMIWFLMFWSLETDKIHITRWFYSQVACDLLELHPSSCWFNVVCVLQTMCGHHSLFHLLTIHSVLSISLTGFCAITFGSYCPGGKCFCACQLDCCIM